MFIAALTMRLPLSYRTAASVLIMGIGYGLYAFAGSYSGLLAVAVFASLGMHMWMPLHSSLAMGLSPKGKTASVVGSLNGIGAFASLIGMGALALVARVVSDLPLATYYFVGAGLVIVAAFLLLRIPPTVGATEGEPPRMLVKKRYWLYYVLTFFQGSRKQVLGTFGMLVLVETFKLEVWHISLILLVSSIINLVGSPYMGRLIDRLGERTVLTATYIGLVLGCIGFATLSNVWLLVLLLLAIKLLVLAGIGLETYVYRMAPEEELTPTLSAGISINHVTSVGMPLLAGVLLPIIGYEGIFWCTAGLIVLSIPFALSMKAVPTAPRQVAVAPAD